ncbi:hypothetical protein BC829DRAFT_449823 [Chytridium lagenaria]|nr:hypothetical protein BC829DRAFT_449823 [Chytridium lagenaria]
MGKVWTSNDQVRLMLEMLVTAVAESKRSQSGFPKDVWTSVSRTLSTEYPDSPVTTAQAKSNWTQWDKLKNLSGFGVNVETGAVTAPDSVWEEYLDCHPDARYFRKKPMMNADLLEVLCAKHVATGKFAVGLKKEGRFEGASKFRAMNSNSSGSSSNTPTPGSLKTPQGSASKTPEQVTVEKGSDKEGSVSASDSENDNNEEKRVAKRVKADDEDTDFNEDVSALMDIPFVQGHTNISLAMATEDRQKRKHRKKVTPDKKLELEAGLSDVLAGLNGWFKSKTETKQASSEIAKKYSLEEVSRIILNLRGQNISADSDAIFTMQQASKYIKHVSSEPSIIPTIIDMSATESPQSLFTFFQVFFADS